MDNSESASVNESTGDMDFMINRTDNHSKFLDSSSTQSDQPLFQDCRLTRTSSHLLISKFAARHSLTDVAVKDLLTLIKLHCPQPNSCYQSLYEFQKDSENVSDKFILHYYCTKCTTEMSSGEETNCPGCKVKVKNVKDSVSSFLEVCIESQLQSLFLSKCRS